MGPTEARQVADAPAGHAPNAERPPPAFPPSVTFSAPGLFSEKLTPIIG